MSQLESHFHSELMFSLKTKLYAEQSARSARSAGVLSCRPGGCWVKHLIGVQTRLVCQLSLESQLSDGGFLSALQFSIRLIEDDVGGLTDLPAEIPGHWFRAAARSHSVYLLWDAACNKANCNVIITVCVHHSTEAHRDHVVEKAYECVDQ